MTNNSKSILTVKVLYNYDTKLEKQLSLRKNEKLEIFKQLPSGWWIAKNKEGNVGLIPSNYVIPEDSDDEGEESGYSTSESEIAIERGTRPRLRYKNILQKEKSKHELEKKKLEEEVDRLKRERDEAFRLLGQNTMQNVQTTQSLDLSEHRSRNSQLLASYGDNRSSFEGRTLITAPSRNSRPQSASTRRTERILTPNNLSHSQPVRPQSATPKRRLSNTSPQKLNNFRANNTEKQIYVVAIKSYKAAEYRHIDIQKGDTLRVWYSTSEIMKGENVFTKEVGLFPASCVTPAKRTNEPQQLLY
jgi:hypothetical protein